MAVKELRGLKAEAKSADRFKEISYQLENKVVELTQTVQKRTAENKELHSRISLLESQTLQLKGQHDEALAKAADLELKLAIPSVSLDQFEEAVRAKTDSEEKLRNSLADVESRDKEIAALAERIQQHQIDMEERTAAHETDIAKNMEQANTVAHLRAELTALKEQISRGNAMSALTRNQREPKEPTSPIMNGLRQFDNFNGAPQRRRQRRHSTGHGTMHARKLSHDEILAIRKGGMGDQPRSVSVMFPADTNVLMRPRDSNGLPTLLDSSSDEVMRLLADDKGLDEDVLGGLIQDLKIPQPSLHTTPFAKEVLFPAHLISLISNEMWKLGMIGESERFLANVMQTIQTYVMVSF
jgi:myosin-5